jgi:hypothetical protein
VAAGDEPLSKLDVVLNQLAVDEPDEQALMAALRGGWWPGQMAAAETLGRRSCAGAAPVLREMLEQEHAIPVDEQYPPVDDVPAGRTTEEAGKRWRLKTALISALGRLGDIESVPLLGRILADSRDAYFVYTHAALALARIGANPAATAEALEALQPALAENEANTQARAEAAKVYLEARLA